MKLTARGLRRFAWGLILAMTGAMNAHGAYDESRDGKADLLASLAEARRSGRMVLVVVGGDWCPTCRLLDRSIQTNLRMQELMRDRFILQKVNYSGKNKNAPATAMLPFFIGYPAAFLLDAQGNAVDMPSVHRFMSRQSFDMDGYADAIIEAAKQR